MKNEMMLKDGLISKLLNEQNELARPVMATSKEGESSRFGGNSSNFTENAHNLFKKHHRKMTDGLRSPNANSSNGFHNSGLVMKLRAELDAAI